LLTVINLLTKNLKGIAVLPYLIFSKIRKETLWFFHPGKKTGPPSTLTKKLGAMPENPIPESGESRGATLKFLPKMVRDSVENLRGRGRFRFLGKRVEEDSDET